MVVVYTLVTYSTHQWTDSDDLYVIRRVHQPPGVALIVRDWRVQGFYPLILTYRKSTLFVPLYCLSVLTAVTRKNSVSPRIRSTSCHSPLEVHNALRNN